MTGKELIYYILDNNLLNVEVFTDNKILGLLTVEQAAMKLHVGNATINAYVMMKRLDTIDINGMTLIIDNYKLKHIQEVNY